MPIRIDGRQTESELRDDLGVHEPMRITDYDNLYPEGLDLHPESELHRRIVDRVLRRARAGNDAISNKKDIWGGMERNFSAFVPLDKKEFEEAAKDTRKPIRIVIPHSYAILESILTFLVATFIRPTIFKYEGVGPEDVGPAALLTHDIAQQCRVNKVGMALKTAYRDSLVYGFAPVGVAWDTITKLQKTTNTGGLLGQFSRFLQFNEMEEVTAFEGNSLVNIDPRKYLPDANVPIHEPQRGEFAGWYYKTNYLDLLSEEETSEGEIFNVRYLRRHLGKRSFLAVDEDSKRDRHNGEASFETGITDHVIDVIPMYVKLIPKDWGLGEGEYPEKWMFQIANDQIVISAERLDLGHNMIPIAVCAPETDGYSVTPTSRMEVVWPMQKTLDWFFNSHYANVRKNINNDWLIDPTAVDMRDMLKQDGGRFIRTLPGAWGRRLDDIVKQFPANDVTRGHVADAAMLIDLMNRVSGSVDQVQGVMQQRGERISASEYRGTTNNAFSRLQMLATIISLTFHQDIARMFAEHTLQFSTMQRYVRLSDDMESDLLNIYSPGQRVLFDPSAISVNYDIASYDGGTQGTEFINEWVQLFQAASADPELRQEFDIPRIFKHIAQLMGAKNLQDFVRTNPGMQFQTQVLPDEQVSQQVDAGQLTAVGG